MGFKIVLFGGVSAISKSFRQRSDDIPWVLVDESTLGNISSVEDYFQESQPGAVVNLSPGGPANLHADKQDVLRDVVESCRIFDVPFIQLSSYVVLDDISGEEIFEDQSADVESEQEARVLAKHLILRTSWMLDGEEGLLSRFVPRLLDGGEEIVVSDHHFGRPLSARFVADTVIAIIQQILTGAENWGTFHVHSSDLCSEAEFCDHLVRQLQKELELELRFPTVAPQNDKRRFLAGNANIAGRRCTENFGVQFPTWRRGFGRLLREWLKVNKQP